MTLVGRKTKVLMKLYKLTKNELVECWMRNPETFSLLRRGYFDSSEDRVVSLKIQLAKIIEENILMFAHGGIIRHFLSLLLCGSKTSMNLMCLICYTIE